MESQDQVKTEGFRHRTRGELEQLRQKLVDRRAADDQPGEQGGCQKGQKPTLVVIVSLAA